MHDHSYLCLRTHKNPLYSHCRCSLHRRQKRVPPPPGVFSDRDLYTKQWRQVQALANQFWTRWSRDYVPSLRHRQKWTVPRRNLQVGDLVLLRDKQTVARIIATFPGKDGHVRKVEVKTTDQGNAKTFLRPITEIVLLLLSDVTQ